MHISKFRIHNYKSHFDSLDVNLCSGINIITGQNNSGKTALLQALSLQFEDKPHRSTKTVPDLLTAVNTSSSVEMQFDLNREELTNYIFNFCDPFILNSSGRSEQYYNDKKFFDFFIKDRNLINVTFLRNKQIKEANLNTFENDNIKYVYHLNKVEKTFTFQGRTANLNSFFKIADLITQRIYFFHAERFNISSFRYGSNEILNPNANNLPEVLAILQGHKKRFKQYLDYIKVIFPQIHDISTRPNPANNGEAEIIIWNESTDLERNDLAVPLFECGTGLGQVLSILYVVLTSDIPKIIIIDEPNSFLHPGACRKLIEILKKYPQHQFIISTHSPSTIAAANPKTINIVRTENAQSYVASIDVDEANQQQLYLAEIGAKLSDVFGADNILWVEGKTEEICFPKIIEATDGLSLMGTSVLGVKNTGDFYSKKSELVFDIYKKLSLGKGLMPAAIGFVFDREELSERQIKDLERKSEKKVHFIGRRLYENYLLNSNAIYAILNNIDEINVSKESITSWIEQNMWKVKFISKDNAQDKTLENWLRKVDGANLLSSLFTDLTKSKVAFDKIKHSVALTDWIIENSIDDLKELQSLLKSILNPTKS